MSADYETGVKEECGVLGIYCPKDTKAALSIYHGLLALQHRGQESCGIAVTDTYGPRGNLNSRKGLGLVSEVFKGGELSGLHGNMGVGHVRYSTTGASVEENAQPLVLKYIKGTLVLAHNGNLINAAALRHSLETQGAIFHTTTDSEVIAHLIARERVHTSSVEEAVLRTAGKIKGAYGLVIMSPRKLVAVRDPYGLKPLCMGQKKDGSYIVASESCALASLGAELLRDIEPGEIITISKDGRITSNYELVQEKRSHCIFEYIYFARLDSQMDGLGIYESRLRAGAALHGDAPAEADLVTGVPESGLTAAMGYAQASGLPFAQAFYKNSYVGRTFIKPTQEEREAGVKVKLNVLSSVVKGKRVVLVDDSIVRGTTIANLIKMMKKAGALEVHVRISSPPFLHPCYFGTDVPSNKQLIAYSHTPEEICSIIGADSLSYLRLSDLSSLVNGLPICSACFDGNYPMDISQASENIGNP